MVLLNSSICEYGKKMPDFFLKNINGRFYSNEQLCGKNGSLIFLCDAVNDSVFFVQGQGHIQQAHSDQRKKSIMIDWIPSSGHQIL